MILCPLCQCEASRVLETRRPDADSIRRRRVCARCKFRWSTIERIMPTAALVAARLVHHRDGSCE
jgi:transcriptional regulator NrdR family protein